MRNYENFDNRSEDLRKKFIAGGLAAVGLMGLAWSNHQEQPEFDKRYCSIKIENGDSLWAVSEELTESFMSTDDLSRIRGDEILTRKHNKDIAVNAQRIADDNAITPNSLLVGGANLNLNSSLCQAALNEGFDVQQPIEK